MLRFGQDLKINCQPCHHVQTDDNGNFCWIRTLRIVTLGISSTALILNIILIFIRKQYEFNTIRLFLLVQIFYALSLISVIPHDPSFNFDQVMNPKDSLCDYCTFVNCLVQQGQSYKGAIQGFINMASYSISYWFAVCITLYIKHVLENTHNTFMQKKKWLIIAVIALIIIWYLVPFILTFQQDAPFSFAPAGYRFTNQNYIFYSGIMARDQSYKWLVVLWMLFLPISLFIYHIYVHYWKNQKYIDSLKDLDEISKRQWFLIKISKLSFIIFIVQFVNFFKLTLGLFSDVDDFLEYLVFVINSLFDFMALILIGIYIRYYNKESKYLQQDSQFLIESQASSHGNMSSNLI